MKTKGNYLNYINKSLPHISILEYFIFTISGWISNKKTIIDKIDSLAECKYVVRSSAVDEDQISKSNAGKYQSYININKNNSNTITSGGKGNNETLYIAAL